MIEPAIRWPITRLHLAEVTLGFDNAREVEIVDGVEDGDLVALNVGQAVEDGDPVQPIQAEPTPAAAPGPPRLAARPRRRAAAALVVSDGRTCSSRRDG